MSTGFKQLHWVLLKTKYQTSFESILQNRQWLFWSLESQFQNGAFVVRVVRVTLLALKKSVLCWLTSFEIVSSVFLGDLISLCMLFSIHYNERRILFVKQYVIWAPKLDVPKIGIPTSKTPCINPWSHYYYCYWGCQKCYQHLYYHLGLAKPSWSFKLVYRVEIFSCNVILMRSLLISRCEI